MNDEQRQSNRTRQLRQAAEEALARSKGLSGSTQKKAVEDLVHELQVHQIELEMQNEELRTAQLALEESRSGYADLYDFAPVGYFTISRNGRITAANLTGATLLGVPRPELIHHGFGRFVAPAEIDRWDRHRLDALQQEGAVGCELALKREDGSTFYARLDSIRMAVDDGAFALRTTVADISERKRAEEAIRESESSLQAILRSTADGLLAISSENRVLFANERFAEMWRIPQEVIAGKDNAALLQYVLDQLIDPQGFLQKVEQLYASDEDSFDTLHFKDGRVFDRLSRPLMLGAELRGRVWSFRDITERKQLEERIRQIRSDLLYAVSHDLKTPLQVLHQSQEMLSALKPGEALEQFQEYSEIWRRNLQRLERMINNLVDSQRGEEDRFPLLLAPCRPEEIVRQVVEDLTGYALASEVQFNLHLPAIPEGSCDAEAITRVVENLLTNAVKFSPKGGRVEVRLGMEGDTLRLEVEDHGAVVSPEDQSQLFQPFQRGHSAQQKGIPGTGLGLYVCRRIVEEHSGTISLESEEGKGTKMIVRLPWMKGQSERDDAPVSAENVER